MMQRTIPLAALAALSLAACARTTTVESTTGEVAATVTPVNSSALPTGSTLTATLDQTIGTKQNKVGDTFTATVRNAVVAQNGETVVPAGAKISGSITGLKPSERVGDQAVVKLDFTTLSFNGRSYPFEAAITATKMQTEKPIVSNETLKKAGIGAAAGAVLGGILSKGDLEKIAIGAVLGGAAGT